MQLHSAPPACDTAGGCDCDMMRYASPRTPHRHAARQRLSNSQFLKTRQNSVGVVRVSLYPAAAWPGTLTLPPRSPLSPARDPAQHCSLTCRHPGPGHRPGSGLQISHLANPHIHLARVRSIHHQPPGQGEDGEIVFKWYCSHRQRQSFWGIYQGVGRKNEYLRPEIFSQRPDTS